tara:strand:+ start:570 stop:989 length:420 start_codon:yes stop_codon:yes gene_type:complete
MLITPLYLEWCNITTPQTRFEPHKYTVTMVLSDEDAQKFSSEGYKINTNEDGEHRMTAKRTVSRTWTDRDTGQTMEKTNEPPKLLDADKQPMDVIVGNGSEGVVQVKPYDNKFGKFFELQGVMITKLNEYNPDENEIQF